MSGPTPTPLGDFFGNEDVRQFERDHSNRFERGTDAAMMAHRERPYLGQPHTHHGERGRTEVRGITFRDLGDCFARGVAQSCAPDEDIGSARLDREAVIQNTLVNVEKMMGIYPNIPKGENL